MRYVFVDRIRDIDRMKKLAEYRQKRHFDKTAEPPGSVARETKARFAIQKHAASRLHYDLRLEVGGVLKSWAVPKGPSLNPGDKRLAVHVEDHPLEYRKFEGVIPKGQYGGGEVIVWDQGTYELEGHLNAEAQLARGELKFILHGKKIRGSFVLVQLKNSKEKNEWLLIKHRDEFADPLWDAEKHAQSIVSGRTLDDVKLGRPARAPLDANKISSLPGARKASMPRSIPLTLASLSEKPFSNPDWLFEVKWDGVRGIAYLANGEVSVRSRAGREISLEYPEVRDLANQLDATEAIVDGELVALDSAGRSNFQKLQNRAGVRNPSQQLLESIPATYYAFDLLYCDGYDLRKVPLEKRKNLIKQILRPNDHIRYSEHEIEKGKELYEAARQQSLEGIIGKKRDSAYVGQRTSLWLKFKIVNELDAVVCGWTAPRRSREFFGALVLGLYDGGQLEFIGSVGTGFDYAKQKEIHEQLQKLRQPKSVFRDVPKLKEKIDWVQPQLVARVKYGNWTDGDRLRAPVFVAMRTDVSPEQCTVRAAHPGKSRGQDHLAERTAEAETRRRGSAKLPAEPHAKRGERQAKSRSETNSSGSSTVSAHNGRQTVRPTKAGETILTAGIESEIREGTSETLNVEIDDHVLRLTHLNKIYFPESGIRKRDLLAYYYRVGHVMLPFLKDRPMVLRRYPNGIREKAFFQKEAPESVPDWIERATVHSEGRGGDMPYLMANNLASLIYLTHLGCIDHNPWSSRNETQDFPDYVFFDLDPTPGTPFSTVLKIARAICAILHSIKLSCFLKTSGASGFHIFVPLKPQYTYAQTRGFAELVGRIADNELPGLITFERTVHNRPRGKVLMDALQNARGKPLATVYSVRAYPGAPVSAPVTPAELKNEFAADRWNLNNVEQRIKKVGNLWEDFWDKRQSLSVALELLDQRLSPGKNKTTKTR
ncbi:MAG: bifunctional non-ous end joining protein LigD [Acidobacteriaceae bacterium]|nr:bifunctional non-ous end joining protein LigD [Acidobacteriaceae bacterium]